MTVGPARVQRLSGGEIADVDVLHGVRVPVAEVGGSAVEGDARPVRVDGGVERNAVGGAGNRGVRAGEQGRVRGEDSNVDVGSNVRIPVGQVGGGALERHARAVGADRR